MAEIGTSTNAVIKPPMQRRNRRLTWPGRPGTLAVAGGRTSTYFVMPDRVDVLPVFITVINAGSVPGV